jgi:Na+-transporting methylmalonyl-CoA/oxaloacetate decarboxylase gamma subunit
MYMFMFLGLGFHITMFLGLVFVFLVLLVNFQVFIDNLTWKLTKRTRNTKTKPKNIVM